MWMAQNNAVPEACDCAKKWVSIGLIMIFSSANNFSLQLPHCKHKRTYEWQKRGCFVQSLIWISYRRRSLVFLSSVFLLLLFLVLLLLPFLLSASPSSSRSSTHLGLVSFFLHHLAVELVAGVVPGALPTREVEVVDVSSRRILAENKEQNVIRSSVATLPFLPKQLAYIHVQWTLIITSSLVPEKFACHSVNSKKKEITKYLI